MYKNLVILTPLLVVFLFPKSPPIYFHVFFQTYTQERKCGICLSFCLHSFETESRVLRAWLQICCVAKDDLQIFLPLSFPKYWSFRCVSPCQVFVFLSLAYFSSHISDLLFVFTSLDFQNILFILCILKFKETLSFISLFQGLLGQNTFVYCCLFKKLTSWAREMDGLVVESTCCSCRGLRFYSQYPHSTSQLSVTPVP